MFRNEKLELKVGLFIGVGIFLMFFIVLSIKDISMVSGGYEFDVLFDYVNGIKESAPVRQAGVDVGEVSSIKIFYDGEKGFKRVKVTVKVKEGTEIEKNSAARINTLGLLGERYMEITPGKGDVMVQAGDVIEGHTPFDVGKHMEKMGQLIASFGRIAYSIESGEGTFGKLIKDDSLYVEMEGMLKKINRGSGTLSKLLNEDDLYENMEIVVRRLKDGEGTIGKLLADDKIYNDAESMVEDIKSNPWKLLYKPRTRDR